jgi:GNAT superfamily N-acetyltransferase
MTRVRPYRADDLDALYRICLATGDAGADAATLYRDPKIIGEVYAAPYGVLAPQTAFVVEDEEGVGGYMLGVTDTYAFEKRCEAEWWPHLRARYPDPGPAPHADLDARMAWLIHHPPRTPRRISEPYPAHLHIDLLPRFQGQGLGKRLIDTWLACVAALGAKAAHLGVGVRNVRAVEFYRRYGFREIERAGEVIVFGIETRKGKP